MTKSGKPLTGWQIAAVGGIFAAMIGAEFITQRNLTPAQRARRDRDKAQRAAQSAADRAAVSANNQREWAAEAVASKAKNAWLQSAKGQTIIREATGMELPVRTPFADVTVSNRSPGFAATGTAWESKSAGARLGTHSSPYDGIDGWGLDFDGERIGGELYDGARFILKCQKGKAHLTERQRDVILRLLGTLGGPKSVVFERWYDHHEVDELYRKYGG